MDDYKGCIRYEVYYMGEEVYIGYSFQGMKDTLYDYVFSCGYPQFDHITLEDIEIFHKGKLQEIGFKFYQFKIQNWKGVD